MGKHENACTHSIALHVCIDEVVHVNFGICPHAFLPSLEGQVSATHVVPAALLLTGSWLCVQILGGSPMSIAPMHILGEQRGWSFFGPAWPF
jgi:hypothetical protein